ncbi:MAG: hypothetical protein ACI4FZ_13160 [Lachnospiraceae bacterium]
MKCISERTGERAERVALYGGSRYHAKRTESIARMARLPVKVEWNRVSCTSS